MPTTETDIDPAESDVQYRTWLRDTAAGDRQAFERLYRAQHGRLARFLLRLTTRRDLVDDVVNDTMWIVWRKAGEFRGESRVSTWITGIAYRCMLKALRDHVPTAEVSESTIADDELERAAPRLNADDDFELHDWLARGLRTLPTEQRVTLELAYFVGESCEDIALIMGCAVGTVKARLFHARVRLRTVLPDIGSARRTDHVDRP